MSALAYCKPRADLGVEADTVGNKPVTLFGISHTEFIHHRRADRPGVGVLHVVSVDIAGKAVVRARQRSVFVDPGVVLRADGEIHRIGRGKRVVHAPEISKIRVRRRQGRAEVVEVAPAEPTFGKGYRARIFAATGSMRPAGMAFTPASAPVFSAANEVRVQPGVLQLSRVVEGRQASEVVSARMGGSLPLSASVGTVPSVALAAPLL